MFINKIKLRKPIHPGRPKRADIHFISTKATRCNSVTTDQTMTKPIGSHGYNNTLPQCCYNFVDTRRPDKESSPPLSKQQHDQRCYIAGLVHSRLSNFINSQKLCAKNALTVFMDNEAMARNWRYLGIHGYILEFAVNKCNIDLDVIKHLPHSSVSYFFLSQNCTNKQFLCIQTCLSWFYFPLEMLSSSALLSQVDRLPVWKYKH